MNLFFKFNIYYFFFLSISVTSNAQECLRQRQVQSILPTGFDIEKYLNLNKLSSYESDSCVTEYKINKDADYAFICKDETISFVNTAKSFSEGRCGDAAAANVLAMHCNVKVSISALEEIVFKDAIPGIGSDLLADGLNKIKAQAEKLNYKCFPPEKNFKVKVSNELSFINDLEKAVFAVSEKSPYRIDENGIKKAFNPVPVLIRAPSDEGLDNLHWVTVVDVSYKESQCRVRVNEMGAQRIIPCKHFTDLASLRNCIFGVICSTISDSAFNLIELR